MIRPLVTKTVTDFLKARYDGPIGIHEELDAETLAPPYAVVRIASATELFPDQAEVWDLVVMVGIFHDADTTGQAAADAAASELVAHLRNPDPFVEYAEEKLVISAWELSGSEASIAEDNWQSVYAYHLVASPL